jgi:hypothetical protein
MSADLPPRFSSVRLLSPDGLKGKEAYSSPLFRSGQGCRFYFEIKKNITRVPTTFFFHIGHLTTLRLQSISPIDFCDDSSLTRAVSKGKAPMASHTVPVIDRCVGGFGQNLRGTRFPSSVYFRRQKALRDRHDHSRYSCHSCAVHASLKSTSASVPQPYIALISCPSSWNHFASPATLEHLKLNIRFLGNIYNIDLMRIYVTLMFGGIWTPLPLFQGSRLRRVNINIDYAFCYDSGKEYKVEKAVFDGLPFTSHERYSVRREMTWLG